MKLELKDKQVLVLGLGDTGISALRWLKRQGALLSVADTREVPPGLDFVKSKMPDIPIFLGEFDHTVLTKVDLIVISPGISLAEPMVQAAIRQGVKVVGDVELFAQNKLKSAKVIAITGSNGKSTVTTMVGDICNAAGLKTVVAGNIGLPVLDTLLDATEKPDVYVLELSSFQLETTDSLNPDAATVLNISEDHMDRYESFDAYVAAKNKIFSGDGVQVLNRQDSLSIGMALIGRQVVTFGLDAPIEDDDFGLLHTENNTQLLEGSQILLTMQDLKISGSHNATNALAAMALCKSIGIPTAPMLVALKAYQGLSHRVEWIAKINQVDFYDDSKGTNVGATCAALEGLVSPDSSKKIILIVGGDGKGQDFTPLRGPIEKNARAVVFIGRDGGKIKVVLKDLDVDFFDAESMADAVKKASCVAQDGDAVLLSPACASFDMFRNYVHRAEVFVESVLAIKKEKEASR
jgi:UDP-N-acetylmuramoylalanine--D-glutamate ligase